jgi:hypothetical protein
MDEENYDDLTRQAKFEKQHQKIDLIMNFLALIATQKYLTLIVTIDLT